MIDPILSLAFAVQSNPGVYAVLLGSGVSRASQIPTGWEIVLDLVRKVAAMLGEDCEPRPEVWYREKFGHDADYSRLLDSLGSTPEERQQLLRRYFEPTEEEREQGLKMPTAAHRSIASLMARGYVRVALTTNFDRLLERAIEDEGLTPVVLSTPDAVEGAVPLVHQRCCVIKLHGDYLDVRIRNTSEELSQYDPRLGGLLDQVLDEFGLIVAGWSAQWDPALCEAFERCKSRRFGTYWAKRGRSTDRAKRLIEIRRAEVLNVASADALFADLADKVFALEQLGAPHPITAAAAAATAKRMLADESRRIALRDLVTDETERVYAALQIHFDHILSGGQAEFRELMSRLDMITGVLAAVVIQVGCWGAEPHRRLIARVVERLASDPKGGLSGTHLNDMIRVIPAQALLYQVGIAALANDNLPMLVAALRKPTVTRLNEVHPLLVSFEWRSLQAQVKRLEGHERHLFPFSEWAFRHCRGSLTSLVPDDAEYARLFDLYETLRGFIYVELKGKGRATYDENSGRNPLGRIAYQHAHVDGSPRMPVAALLPGGKMARRLLAEGTFDGDVDTYRSAHTAFLKYLAYAADRCSWGREP